MKVWIVTSGCYSDFGIEAVFDNEAAAKALAAAVSSGDGQVDPWEVGSAYDASRVRWAVFFYDAELETTFVDRLDDEQEYCGGMRVNDPPQRRVSPGEEDVWQVVVRAPNPGHARKIATEQVMMAKARLAGIGD